MSSDEMSEGEIAGNFDFRARLTHVCLGFNHSVRTIFAGTMAYDTIVQIIDSEIRLICAVTLELLASWSPAGSDMGQSTDHITVGRSNEFQV